jgi:hypothetical protein
MHSRPQEHRLRQHRYSTWPSHVTRHTSHVTRHHAFTLFPPQRVRRYLHWFRDQKMAATGRQPSAHAASASSLILGGSCNFLLQQQLFPTAATSSYSSNFLLQQQLPPTAATSSYSSNFLLQQQLPPAAATSSYSSNFLLQQQLPPTAATSSYTRQSLPDSSEDEESGAAFIYLCSGSAGGARHCGAPMLRRYAATSAMLQSMAHLSGVWPKLQGR